MDSSKVRTHDVDDCAETTEPTRAARNAPTERVCLTCGQPFLSEGWHNRLCGRCRKRSEPADW